MRKLTLSILAAAAILAGCTRIETGEVGLRVNFSKEVQMQELMPGSWNQTIVGDVLTYPVKDISLTVDNQQPLTSDNSALADFDFTVIYSITPTCVAEIFSTKSKAFHATDEKGGDIYLMYNYLYTTARNAAYKVVREFESLKVADSRVTIENSIRENMQKSLEDEKLDKCISITKVMIRNIAPNTQILQAATDYVRAQNELRVKSTEVEIAKKESERMAALAQNSTQSIQYMQAQAAMKIAEGIANGKVQTIVVPLDFKGMVNVGK